MQKARLVSTSFPIGCKQSFNQFPVNEPKNVDMSQVPYASVVGSLLSMQ